VRRARRIILGPRRWRICRNRGCDRPYYGQLETCPDCRDRERMAEKVRAERRTA